MGQFIFGLIAGIVVGLVMEWVIDWTGLLPNRSKKQVKQTPPLQRPTAPPVQYGGEQPLPVVENTRTNIDASGE